MAKKDKTGTAADVDEVLAAIKRQPSRVRGGHSPVYLWLWQHHERLKGELNLPRRTDWSALAGELGKRGIVDGNGKPLTAERTRKAWWQVNRDKEVVATGATPRRRKVAGLHGKPREPANLLPAGKPTPTAPAPTANSGMLPPGIGPAEEEPPKYTFKFAKPKDWTKEPDKGDE